MGSRLKKYFREGKDLSLDGKTELFMRLVERPAKFGTDEYIKEVELCTMREFL